MKENEYGICFLGYNGSNIRPFAKVEVKMTPVYVAVGIIASLFIVLSLSWLIVGKRTDIHLPDITDKMRNMK